MPWYKAVRPDRRSHWDGSTLWTKGRVVRVPNPDPPEVGPCGQGVHASPTILGAVGYQSWPSRYCEVAPLTEPIAQDGTKGRFRSVRCVRWLEPEEVDSLAGFKLTEANRPVNPLSLPKTRRISLEEAVILASQWDSVWHSVRHSVGHSVRHSVGASVWHSVWHSAWASAWDSVGNSVGHSVWHSVGHSVGNSVGHSVWHSVGHSVGHSVWDSVWAYIGGLFPGITTWKYAESRGPDPWRPLLTLWYGGYVPSFDGKTWRLHTGRKAEIVWTGDKET